jgi:hypothetical protein
VWAKTSKTAGILFVRFNNSTRALPDEEVKAYIDLRWPNPPS